MHFQSNFWKRFMSFKKKHHIKSALTSLACNRLGSLHGVYLCLIFEISIWEFITNSKKNRFRNKLDFLSSSNLIFAGYTGIKNQVRTRQKIEFVSKSFFFEFEIEKKSSDTRYFKNQVEIDRGIEN